jgi:DNA invertase Pin-like site-specific DNA recombinase
MEIDKVIEDVCSTWEQDQYAMYLRKSRTDLELEALGEGETLARHQAMLEALAAKHNISMNQISVYREVVSGDSIDERPEMQRLLADVYANKFKAVLVVEIERLARGNTKDQGEVADAFTFSNTHIITPAKVYDPNNEFDQEYFEFGLFMSRREYKTIKRRLEAGKLQSVKEGNYILPTAPYGYNIVKRSRKERTLVENPEESKFVRMIFDWYTEDRKPTTWIANQLTEMGVRTRKNKERWSRSTIKDILFNAHYIGKVSWGHQEVIKEKDPVTGKVVKKRRQVEANIQLYEGKHEGIISEEQFWKVRTIYGTNAPTKLNNQLKNPLSGIMFCCDCGRRIKFHDFGDSRSTRYNHPFRMKCKKKSVAASVVIDAVIEGLKAYIEDFQIKMDNYTAEDEANRRKATLEALEGELKKQEQKKRRLFDSWEADDGTYTKEEFIERKQMYTHTIDKLNEQISDFKKNTPKPVNYEEQIATLHAVIETLKNPNIDATNKNVFLKKVIERITFDSIDHGQNKGATPVLEIFLK